MLHLTRENDGKSAREIVRRFTQGNAFVLQLYGVRKIRWAWSRDHVGAHEKQCRLYCKDCGWFEYYRYGEVGVKGDEQIHTNEVYVHQAKAGPRCGA